MTFQNAKQLPEQIAQHLADKIIRLEFKPGEKLLEEKIAKELGVSRSPLREAFYILNRWYLVDLIPRRGTFVTELSQRHIVWLYDLLSALYVLIIKTTHANFRREDIQAIDVVLKKMEKSAARYDYEAYHKELFEYAALIIKTAGNPLVEKVLHDIWPSKMRVEYAILSQRRRGLINNVKSLRLIAQYVHDRNPKMAEKSLIHYMEQEKAAALNYLQEVPSPEASTDHRKPFGSSTGQNLI
jgi:DNA-binding GntR family transcriptional regulator